MLLDYFGMVKDFMRRGVAIGARQTIGNLLDPKFADTELRVKLIIEEAMEFAEACGFVVREAGTPTNPTWELVRSGTPNLVLAIDALCDLLYVVFGAFVAFGLRPAPYFEEVHASNMTKVGPDAVVREDGKIIKPPSFRPPDLKKILDTQIAAGK